MSTERYRNNINLLYLIRLFSWMHFFSAVLVPFYTEWASLNLTQVFVINAWFMLCNFLLEVPTGTVADFAGRKVSLILGSVTMTISAVLYIIKPSFIMFLFAEFVAAIAATLHSGADEALAYDSLLETGDVSKAKTVLSRMESFKLDGIVFGATVGGFMAGHFGVLAPRIAYIVPAFLAIIFSLLLIEPKGKNLEKKQIPYLQLIKEGSYLLANNKVLLILSIEAALTNAIAWGIIFLFQPILTQAGVSKTYFGIVQSIAALGEILLLTNLNKVETFFRSKRKFLVYTGILTGMGYIILGLVNHIILVVGAILMVFMFGLTRLPVYNTYINRYIPSDKRATVLSLSSMIRTLMIVLVSPLVGALGDWSLNNTAIILGVLVIVVSGFSKIEESFLEG
jgi:MFS family permease